MLNSSFSFLHFNIGQRSDFELTKDPHNLSSQVSYGVSVVSISTGDYRYNSLWPSDMVPQIWGNIGSGNGLLHDGTKPLPEPILTKKVWHSPKDHFTKMPKLLLCYIF